jgi:hypothetical protein
MDSSGARYWVEEHRRKSSDAGCICGAPHCQREGETNDMWGLGRTVPTHFFTAGGSALSKRTRSEYVSMDQPKQTNPDNFGR